VAAHRTSDGKTWVADFRSGTITLDGDSTIMNTNQEMVVELAGLECVVRQEKTDEMYGVVAAIGPGNAHYAPVPFPGGGGTIDMGPDGQRIWVAGGPAWELYRGPLEDLTLVSALIEQDSGDVSAISQEIADKIVTTAGQMLGGTEGAAAEAISNQTWFQHGLGSAIGLVLGGVFGMGDDPYDSQSLPVYWDQLGPDGNPPLQPPARRSDDPKTIDRWTHKMVMTGKDDGGDTGTYIVYFFVRTDQESTIRPERSP
jgi:hypothetical protein